jgi:hypothetical protein
MEKRMKNVVVISDLHCGSVVGLTPPKYQTGDFLAEQDALWEAYTDAIDRFRENRGNIHILLVNGDCIDGKASRWGATDLITSKIHTQISMAAECIDYAGADRIVMTYGTPYHVGAEEDFEKYLADMVGATIKSHAFLEIDGVNFSLKHKVGASTIPHGRSTPVKRERLWDMIWNVEKNQHSLSDVIIRSHVHYFDYTGNSEYLALTTPALQCLGSKYGARMCAGVVDFGIVWFQCEKGEYKWGWDIAKVEEQQDVVIKL